MNLGTAIASRTQSYTSVQEGNAKGFRLGCSKNSSSSKHRSSMPKVSISVLMNTARSMIPKRLLSNNMPGKGGRRIGYDLYQDDIITPVIFYQDEDAVVRRSTATEAFVDPFAFDDTKKPNDAQDDDALKKKAGGVATDVPSLGKITSPTSVFGLFTVEEESSIFGNFSDDDEADEAVFFDDEFFPRSLTSVFEETPIDISESILSINAPSTCENNDAEDETAAASPGQWFGFFNSESFTSCEWDPDSELEMVAISH